MAGVVASLVSSLAGAVHGVCAFGSRGEPGPLLPETPIMSLFCFLRVNTVSSARDACHQQQEMVPVLPHTQRGINGQALSGEVWILFLSGKIVG